MAASLPQPSHADGMLPIGAVVAALQRDYPDVSHSSLRFLEREGLVTATRTPGGHRLYAPADVERIRHIKEWQRQRLSLDDIRQRLAALDRLPAPATLAASFLEQATAGALGAAYRTVIAADEVGMPLLRLLDDVLRLALVEVGERWERGELLVAQEKEISELSRDLIAELSLRHAAVDPRAPVIVAACVEGERHQLGLHMLCGLLRAAGHAVHYLGPDVAPRFLLESVRLHQPDTVLLSVKIPTNLPAVGEAIAALEEALPASRRPRIIVGGQAAAGHAETIRGWGAVPIASERLDESLRAIAAIMPDRGNENAGHREAEG
ncbi:MAG TPA: cobalamin-dependent protein [Thermomicrobiales bacterium]|nr:cobalamin-dependent protein [Thermomicrobiales bacterium]